jgi:hypothetical protein
VLVMLLKMVLKKLIILVYRDIELSQAKMKELKLKEGRNSIISSLALVSQAKMKLKDGRNNIVNSQSLGSQEIKNELNIKEF